MKTNARNKTMVILVLKDDQAKWVPNTHLTQKIRNKTNLKIQELGPKYYQIKSIFDQLNLKKNNIFYFGKLIEDQFKGTKKMERLQFQNMRLKDSLICWYTENFYDEITQPNSLFLQQLVEFNKDSFKVETSSTNKKEKKKSDEIVMDDDDDEFSLYKKKPTNKKKKSSK